MNDQEYSLRVTEGDAGKTYWAIDGDRVGPLATECFGLQPVGDDAQKEKQVQNTGTPDIY